MFKRANKVTALLVAAASVMSIVPAMASTRLGTKDGHITGGAVAYSDGKYAYSGYRTNDDNTGIYYNNGTDEKEKFNEDLDDYTLFRNGKAAKYGTKYIYAVDNADQYLIDLSTGKIVDDETPEDKADAVKAKLKSTLKKTDRYSKTGAWDTVNLGDTLENGDNRIQTRILSDRFGEVWYKYSAKSDKDLVDTQIGTTNTKATFELLGLPTTAPAGVYTIANGLTVSSPVDFAANNVSAFRLAVLNKVAADPVVTNLFEDVHYDAATNSIKGTAKQNGRIEVVDKANYDAFAAKYTIVGGLGVTQIPEYNFEAGTTTSQAVSIAKELKVKNVIDAAQVLVDQLSDSDSAKVAYKNDLSAIAVIGNTPETAVTATQVLAINTLAQNASTAKVADYTTAGINTPGNTLVVATEADYVAGQNVTVATANALIAKAYADGKLGDAYSDAYARREKLIKLIEDQIAIGNDNKARVIITNGTIASNGKLGTPAYYTGYVNENGKYIDVSSLANLYVYSVNAGKTVKIKEFGKENEDYGITVQIAQSANGDTRNTGFKELAQDKDYIYAAVKVNIAERKKVNGVLTNDLVKDGLLQTQTFILKISKAQGDKKDEAYLPKSVEAFQVDHKNIYDNGDVSDAAELIMNYVDGSLSRDGFDTIAFNVKDGALYGTGIKDDNSDKDVVKVFKVALKKDKLDTVEAAKSGKFAEDVDVYVAKLDGDASVDIRDKTRGTAVSFDVDGNVWTVGKGEVTKFTGKEKKVMYTCDRTFDNIDAYDDNNVIVWGDKDEVYSNVGEGTKVTQAESTAVAPVVTTGWVKGTDGTWTFNDVTGTKLTSKWINDKGAWYYLKADGIMATGWYNDNGTWYYLNPASGAMVTGWLKDPNSGLWYYLAGSGAMLSNTTVDGYQLGGSGAWIQ